jgi:sarcosine oxidase
MYDVGVVGLGAMGSAAALELARRGLRVIGFDRFAPPHTMGSSHGHVRLIREAYYEGQVYVPLVRRAFDLWRALNGQAGGRLLTPTGVLMVGRPESGIVTGAADSARTHGIPYEMLGAPELMERFPAFVANGDHVALYEPGAALLHPELCIALQLELASRHGAELRYHEPAAEWTPTGDTIDLRTASGRYRVRQLVLCPGAWMPELTGGIALPLTVERQVQHWWEPAQPELFRAGRMPVSMFEMEDGRLFYTMPDTGHGVKIGWHHSGHVTTADNIDRTVSADERAAISTLLERHLPLARGRERAAAACLYTNTPDAAFIIARHPAVPAALIVSACSGHGFKFSTVIGEIVADLLTTGRSAFDLTPFALRRFD